MRTSKEWLRVGPRPNCLSVAAQAELPLRRAGRHLRVSSRMVEQPQDYNEPRREQVPRERAHRVVARAVERELAYGCGTRQVPIDGEACNLSGQDHCTRELA